LNLNINIVNNRAYEDDVATIIEKSNDKERFFDTKIKTNNVYIIKQALYKNDYEKIKRRKSNQV
jgi:hypothetical protein